MPRKATGPIKKRIVPLFAREFAKAKTRAGLTTVALQEMTGISRPTLIDYEAGRTAPGVRQIWLLCKGMRVTPNQLIFGTEHPFRRSHGLPKVKARTGKSKAKKAPARRK